MISPAKKRGFTLLELMVVVAITMVISAMALPRIIEAVTAYRLRTTVSGLAGMFQKTRMQAVSDDRWYSVGKATAGGATYAFGDLNNDGDLDADKESQLVSYLPAGSTIETAGAPGDISVNLDFTPTPGLPAFNARGLPCTPNGATCQPKIAFGTGAEGTGYVCYVRQARPLGGASWAGISVSPAGRIRVWTWNGGAWK